MRNIYLGLLAIFITLGGISMQGHAGVFAGAVSIDTSKVMKATISTKITDTCAQLGSESHGILLPPKKRTRLLNGPFSS